MSFSQRPAVRSLALHTAFLLVALGARAATLTGHVVGIADGDTVTVLDTTSTRYTVRLAGIDAPEKHQPFGHAARQALATLAFEKPVFVEFHKRDKYGRLVGKVVIAGNDAGLALLQAGMAWHYVAYAREQRPDDRQAYSDAEAEARIARRGLWSAPDPQPPWEFRLARRRH